MYDNIKKVLDSVLEEFKNGKIGELISFVKFPAYDIPCNSWSLMNQILVYSHETTDARGYRQWGEAKRHVKKGSKSFQILVPCFKKREKENGEEVNLLTYFTTGNVFRVEDTEGKELDYESIKLPDLPLLDRAKELGLDVKAVCGTDKFYGYYEPSKKMIALATPEEKVFFHELTHHADEQCNGKLKQGQEPLQEIVAELGAEALCRILGKDPRSTANSYRYIEVHAKEIGITAHAACLKVISRVDKALNFILKGGKLEKASNN